MLFLCQLEKHVTEWKRKVLLPNGGSAGAGRGRGRGSGTSGGGEGSLPLEEALRAVAAIEAGILQANADSLLIIDNISGVLNHMKK